MQLPDDNAFQYGDVALLDFEDKTGDCRNGTVETNAVVRGKAPPGEYKGLVPRGHTGEPQSHRPLQNAHAAQQLRDALELALLGQAVRATLTPALHLQVQPAGGLLTALIPADNPITPEKVELGRHLFYDKRLSDNQTQSCASCHQQEKASTDGRPVGLGSTGSGYPSDVDPFSVDNVLKAIACCQRTLISANSAW